MLAMHSIDGQRLPIDVDDIRLVIDGVVARQGDGDDGGNGNKQMALLAETPHEDGSP